MFFEEMLLEFGNEDMLVYGKIEIFWY